MNARARIFDGNGYESSVVVEEDMYTMRPAQIEQIIERAAGDAGIEITWGGATDKTEGLYHVWDGDVPVGEIRYLAGPYVLVGLHSDPSLMLAIRDFAMSVSNRIHQSKLASN